MKYRWDVFIAYHGSYQENGSREKAREIYDILHGEHNVNCYFYPENGGGCFGNSTDESCHSRLFLLVANKNIVKKLDNNGEINEPEPIYEEMRSFYQTQMRSHAGRNGAMRVYCYDGYTDAQADNIYPVATKNVDHFDESRDGSENKSFTKLLEWIQKAIQNPVDKTNEEINNNDEKNIQLNSEKKRTTNTNKYVITNSKNKNLKKIINFFHYVVKQHSWILTSFIFVAILLEVFVYFYYTKSKIILYCVFFTSLIFLVIISFCISFFKKFRDIGFKNIYSSAIFGEAKPQNIMKSSKRKICFLGIASSKWLSNEKVFKETLMRLCSDECGGIEFLLLNPKSEYAKRMDIACKPGEITTSGSIEKCLKKITQIVHEVCQETGINELKGFSIRLYSHYPTYRIIISDDDRIFLSFYTPGNSGNNNYQIKIDGSKKNTAYSCLKNYYNQIWNDETTINYKITF